MSLYSTTLLCCPNLIANSMLSIVMRLSYHWSMNLLPKAQGAFKYCTQLMDIQIMYQNCWQNKFKKICMSALVEQAYGDKTKPWNGYLPCQNQIYWAWRDHKFYVRPAERRNVKYVMEKYEKWVGQKSKIQCLKFPSIIRRWTCVRLTISWAQRDYHTVVSDHHTICPKLNQQTNE